MTIRADIPPDVARPDISATMFGFWQVDSSRQRATIDALSENWEGKPFSAPGMVFYTLFAALDGQALLHYVQLVRSDVAPEPSWKDPIDRKVPGIHRIDATLTHLYRSTERLPDAPRPGCYSLVMMTLDSPGPDEQRAWVDGVLEAADTAVPPPDSGLIAAHFHLSADGTRIVNLAEWTTPEAHQRAAGESAPILRAATQRQPAVRDLTVLRCQFEFSILPGPSVPDAEG